ncbi:MAG: glycosyltransferase family 1 protein [Bacteroidota bacterium]
MSDKTNVLFDPQIFTMQRFGGISRYFFELISRVEKELNVTFPIYYHINEYIREKYPNEYKNTFGWNFKGKDTIRDYLIRYSDKKRLNFLKNSARMVYHPTYYGTNPKDIPNDTPVVLTVYDMIHELFYDSRFEQQTTVSAQKANLIPRADKIIAISENTKKDILELYPQIRAEKIQTIHLGSSMRFSSSKIDNDIQKSLDKDYFLYVGDRRFYKNFLWLLSTILPFLTKTDTMLVVAGGGELTSYEKKQIQLHGDDLSKSVLFMPSCTDEELASLYTHASIFLFPSKYEGFGIPILESFQLGCPVLLPYSSCFPEVAENAAVYYELNEKDDFIDKIDKLYNDQILRKKMISLGYERLKYFSWEKCSNEHIEIYNELGS